MVDPGLENKPFVDTGQLQESVGCSHNWLIFYAKLHFLQFGQQLCTAAGDFRVFHHFSGYGRLS
mgnify:FL=1